jgi:hypothetical protein
MIYKIKHYWSFCLLFTVNIVLLKKSKAAKVKKKIMKRQFQTKFVKLL